MSYLLLALLLINLFFAAWLNAKFIKDASGKDQYWHTVQFYGWIWIYLSYALIPLLFGMPLLYWLFNVVKIIIGFGLMYSLIYNSLLDLMRRFKITHLGRYDFLSFTWTVILFFIGLILIYAL